MRIVTNIECDPYGQGIWTVVADWMGAERAVFAGSIFDCIRYRKREERAT